jgi:hypothetical protein
MKPDAAIAEQMISEANKDYAFTAKGKLIAKLPPKRRFKISADYSPAYNSESLGEKTGRGFYPLKRSGQPHRLWKTKSSTLVTKIGFNETISDGMARFVSHLHLAEAR